MEDLVSARTKLRSRATRLCNELRTYRESDRKTLDPDILALKLHHVEQVQTEVHGIQTQLDKEGHMDDTGHAQSMADELFLGSRLLVRLEKAEDLKAKGDQPTASAHADLRSSVSVKIPTFHGDIMKWAEFWELYQISVHDNPGYADVQRFVTLKSHLAGVALKCVQGIPVSGDGYAEAVSALKERFERNDVRRETLMKDMLNMPSVRPNDLKGMRSLIDHLSSHTRALSTLGVSSASFSTMMLPVVKDKIPESWRIEWARHNSGGFPEFLTFLKEEIRIREAASWGTAHAAFFDDSFPMPPEAASDMGHVPSPVASEEGPTPFSPGRMPVWNVRSDVVAREPDRQAHHRYNVMRSEPEGFFQTTLVKAEVSSGRRKARLHNDGGSDASNIRNNLAIEPGLPVTGAGTSASIGIQEKMEEDGVVEPSVAGPHGDTQDGCLGWEGLTPGTGDARAEAKSKGSKPTPLPSGEFELSGWEGLTPGTGEARAEAQSKGLKPTPLPSGEFCLPHHGISRNGKLRPIFDGSVKDRMGPSLDEYLIVDDDEGTHGVNADEGAHDVGDDTPDNDKDTLGVDDDGTLGVDVQDGALDDDDTLGVDDHGAPDDDGGTLGANVEDGDLHGGTLGVHDGADPDGAHDSDGTIGVKGPDAPDDGDTLGVDDDGDHDADDDAHGDTLGVHDDGNQDDDDTRDIEDGANADDGAHDDEAQPAPQWTSATAKRGVVQPSNTASDDDAKAGLDEAGVGNRGPSPVPPAPGEVSHPHRDIPLKEARMVFDRGK